MNETVILVVDYEKICRLCLQTTGAMSDIFENNEGTSLQKLILSSTGLEVKLNDGLPSKICHKCRYVVELSCELRDMAVKTHLLLTQADNNLDKEIIEQEEKCAENLDQHALNKEFNKNNHMNLELAMQDGGQLTLLNNEPVTTVDVNDNNNTRTSHIERKINKKKKHFLPRVRQAPAKHLTCQMCMTSFSTMEEVSAHIQTHYVDSNLTPYLKLKRPYKCEACNSGIISKTKLITHHRNHLNINPFICKHPGCGFVGKNMDSLRKHVVAHGARSQVCEECGARYRRRRELRQHVARAHTAATHYCRPCRKHFRNVLTYKAHLVYHKPPKHACSWLGCSKAYHSAAALTAHQRVHAGERSFRCHLCAAAAYTSQSLLNRHLRMHERDRLSKCDKCSATFEDYSAFYQHRVSEHGPWQPHRCVGCNKGYQTEGKLEKHVQTCEHAIRMKSIAAADSAANTEEILATQAQEVMPSANKTYQLAEVSEDLLVKFKGQSLLVQSGNINDLSKDLVLQELPAEGLLYIEVESEADEDRTNESWHQ